MKGKSQDDSCASHAESIKSRLEQVRKLWEFFSRMKLTNSDVLEYIKSRFRQMFEVLGLN
jgi:hypothetical protein